MEYKEIPLRLKYYQFDYNEQTGKYENKRKVYYDGVFKVSHPISLILNFNTILGNPYDADDLFMELIEKKRTSTNALNAYINQHPIMEKFQYVGKQLAQHNNKPLIGTELRYVEFFNKYWRPKGIIKPKPTSYCSCSYGKRPGQRLITNHYLFNTEAKILVIVGNDCIDRFSLKPKCKKCGCVLTLVKAIKYDLLCKECRPPPSPTKKKKNTTNITQFFKAIRV